MKSKLPDEKLNKGLLVTAYVLLALSAGLSIYLIINNSIDYPVGLCVVDLISVVLALVYFIKGYAFSAANYFKLAMFFNAAAYVLDYLLLAINPTGLAANAGTYISLAVTLIMYGNTLLIAVGKDLGQRASLIIYGSNIALYIINILATNNTSAAAEIAAIIWISNTVVGLIMIRAKYIDKTNRHPF